MHLTYVESKKNHSPKGLMPLHPTCGIRRVLIYLACSPSFLNLIKPWASFFSSWRYSLIIQNKQEFPLTDYPANPLPLADTRFICFEFIHVSTICWSLCFSIYLSVSRVDWILTVTWSNLLFGYFRKVTHPAFLPNEGKSFYLLAYLSIYLSRGLVGYLALDLA